MRSTYSVSGDNSKEMISSSHMHNAPPRLLQNDSQLPRLWNQSRNLLTENTFTENKAWMSNSLRCSQGKKNKICNEHIWIHLSIVIPYYANSGCTQVLDLKKLFSHNLSLKEEVNGENQCWRGKRDSPNFRKKKLLNS